MNPNQEITLKLPVSVVEFLLNVVNEQPRRVADPIFHLIQRQAAPQVNPTPVPPPADAASEQ
jgi:hypothetical protein